MIMVFSEFPFRNTSVICHEAHSNGDSNGDSLLCNIQDMEALLKEKDMLQQDKEALEVEKLSLTKTVGNLRKDVRERDKQVNICACRTRSTRLISEACMTNYYLLM